jgi:hypothetical protein
MNVNEIVTKQDIKDLFDALNKRFDDLEGKITSSEGAQTYTISELSKLGIIGKYTRIKTLINKGILKSLPDGRISKTEVTNYLASEGQ